MLSLQQFIFTLPLGNTSNCTQLGSEGIATFIKIKENIISCCCFQHGSKLFGQKSRASLNAQGMSYLELQNPRNLVSGGVFVHFTAAVPSRGDGISLCVSIWEWKYSHIIQFFLYVLACIRQHFGSECTADRKCFSIHILCSKAAFQQVSPVRKMGGKGKFKSSPKAKTSHLDFRTDCRTVLME